LRVHVERCVDVGPRRAPALEEKERSNLTTSLEPSRQWSCAIMSPWRAAHLETLRLTLCFVFQPTRLVPVRAAVFDDAAKERCTCFRRTPEPESGGSLAMETEGRRT
jgi:hypothetical protein